MPIQISVARIMAKLNAPAGSSTTSANTIAAVIANEFAEASAGVYLSALIELALVLFALTIAINAIARLLVLSTSSKGSA